jgi:hypothetical protein
MKSQGHDGHIEILPAALLSKRSAWRGKARRLPAGACLLITNPKNSEQTQLMRTLTRSFRQQGKQAILWAIKAGGRE